MKTFFTPEEREALRQVYAGNVNHLLGVYNEGDDVSRLRASFEKDCNRALDLFDVSMGYTAESMAELQDPANRKGVMKLLKSWFSLPQLMIDHAVLYIKDEIEGRDFDGGKAKPLAERLEKGTEKLELAKKFMTLSERFPFMFSGTQWNYALSLDEEGLKSINAQFAELDRLTLEGIASGNIDYPALDMVNKYHSPFTATLFTLADMENMERPEGYSFMPIVNGCFHGHRRFDFKGVVAAVPNDVHEAVASIDPRVYSLGRESVDLRNFLTALLLMPNGKAREPILKICQDVNEGNHAGVWININSNLLLNAGALFGDKGLMKRGSENADMIMDPKKAVAASLRKRADEAHLPISDASIAKAAAEIADPGFLVKFRHMRCDRSTDSANDIPAAMNAVLTAIDTLGKDSFVAPVMYLYAQQMGHDLEYLTINGPKNMEGGGKFYHKHRDFFEKFKADPKGVDAMQQFRIIQEMLEHKLEKGIRKYIEETVEGAQISAAALHMGQVDSAVMHYLSVRIPKRVLVEQVNKMGPEDLMMGYAMHNCLEMIDLMRFHANPDARVYALWLNGQRVGMSYDLEIAQEANGQEPVKAPLIDSVEFSDEFFKAFRALYGAVEEGTGKPIKIPDMLPAKMFVTGYLFSRLQQSEKGIYVLPESNNIHVRAAMREFIGLYGGKPVLGYNGVRLKTDTDFTHMPFWIDKSAIEGQVQSAWFDTDLKVAKPGTPAFENNPMISDAANEQLRTAYRQIEESTSGKHADVSAKELFPNL